VAEGRIKGRVKGLIAGAPPPELAAAGIAAPPPDALLPLAVPVEPAYDRSDPDAQRQALQVLTLAQRTADDHLAAARRQAETIQAEGRTVADQIVRDAQAHADEVRREAGTVMAEARAMADKLIHEAQAEADDARRDADKTVADARSAAADMINEAHAAAVALEDETAQRYEEAIGGLDAERAELQQQIEALQQFDRDYRLRLRMFMHGQLRALDEDDPLVTPEFQQANPIAAIGVQPIRD
jgi:cell division septum initiation protein DivIVA